MTFTYSKLFHKIYLTKLLSANCNWQAQKKQLEGLIERAYHDQTHNYTFPQKP